MLQNLDEVPVYRSESEEEEEGAGSSVAVKKNRRNKIWVLIKRCYNVQEAEEFVSNEKT